MWSILTPRATLRLEGKLADIIINLKATLEEVKTRAAREKFKLQVSGCLRAWRDWNVYSPDYLAQLDIIFSGGKRKKQVEELVDEVDGIPLDVDGVPLSKDVDGSPLEEDIAPEDIFDTSPKRKSKPGTPLLNSKWEDPPASSSKWEKNSFAPSLGSKWESGAWEGSEEKKQGEKRGVNSAADTKTSADSDTKRRKKREIEVKVAEYVDKLEAGKCTRIKQITTNDQAEMYRYLLYKGRDAKKIIKAVATGKQSLVALQADMKKNPATSPVIKGSKKPSGGLSGLVSYGSSPTSSRSPSPELKRKREHSEKKKKAHSPKHERKKKSRHWELYF